MAWLRGPEAPLGAELERIREEVELARATPTIWPWRKDIPFIGIIEEGFIQPLLFGGQT